MTHPITPPRELTEQWASEKCYDERDWLYELHIAARAAQWGADQELEACCEYLVRCAQWEPEDVDELRTARRPKPPSLKLQALNDLNTAYNEDAIDDTTYCNIRRALEALDD
jgi:hypothetical protein